MSDYETIIGLEMHVQMSTDRKMYCGCLNRYGEKPNTLMCPTCLGLPGALPVVNREAVERAIRAAVALDCRIVARSDFDRKNYFYPDLPKNYQITQYNNPYAVDGRLEIETEAGGKKTIRINNAHIEEDTGKSRHGDNGRSLVDLNRAGVPLLEIVTEPDIGSVEEAGEFCARLKAILQYADVSGCNMERGNLRVDVNVNIRDTRSDERTAISEIKNINSFRYMMQALRFEEKRHIAALERGEKLVHETRLFDSERGETRPMRSKEGIMDYRYFPEPDLNPLDIREEWVAGVRAAMPEMPDAKKRRYIKDLGLIAYDVTILINEPAASGFFEECVELGAAPTQTAKWINGELRHEIKDGGYTWDNIPVTTTDFVGFIKVVNGGTINDNIGKIVLSKMIQSGDPPAKIIEREGLAQISDSGALEEAVRNAIADNPKAVADYYSGKKSAAGFLMGQVMRLTKGKANPATVQSLLKKNLSQGGV